MKILMLVHNTVERDSRVIKEATTLTAAGHEVRVIGIADAQHIGEKRMPGGFTVVWGQRAGQNDLDLPAQDVPRRIISALGRAVRFVRKPAGLALAAVAAVVVAGLILVLASWQALVATAVVLIALAVLCAVFLRSASGRRVRPELGTLFHLALNRLFEDGPRRDGFTRNVGEFIPDVVHCHDLEPLTAARVLARRYKALFVWDAHELYDEIPKLQEVVKRSHRRLIRRMSAHLDGFITINDSIAADYARRFAKLPPATIVKNATEFDPTWELPVSDGRLRAAAGLPADRKILLHQGGFSFNRGLEPLVRNAAALPAGWSLVLMGWGALETELAASAAAVNKATGDPHRVALIPPAPQADLAAWSSGATLGVILYENTGKNHLYCTPNKLWEFPAAGVPIVCSDLVELRQAVTGANIGWVLADDNDPKALSSLIAGLTQKDLDAARKNCLAYIAEDNWAVYAHKLVEFYEQLPTAV